MWNNKWIFEFQIFNADEEMLVNNLWSILHDKFCNINNPINFTDLEIFEILQNSKFSWSRELTSKLMWSKEWIFEFQIFNADEKVLVNNQWSKKESSVEEAKQRM